MTLTERVGHPSQILNMTLGNGIAGSFTYNDHFQVDSLRYANGAAELLKLVYKYVAPNGGNNGQIQGIDDNTGGTNIAAKSTSYSYDDWLRLRSAQTNDLTSPQTWKLGWDYDRYGNRLNQNLLGGTLSVTAPQLSVSPTTNRITTTGYSYDANGNMTNDSLHTYVYDAENRIVSLDSDATTYSYDGNGLRVKSVTGSPNGTNRTVIFSGTKPIAEYLGTPPPRREYIYAGSQLLVRLDNVSGTTTATYELRDHLSNRIDTDTSGVAGRTLGTLPFGDVWYETGTAQKWKFTTYERDTESNLDYAIMRFDSWRLGRFMSPDPLAGDTANPQSLNRYAYVLNDPVSSIDPLGLGEFFEALGCLFERVDFFVDGAYDSSEIFLIGCRPAVPPLEPLQGDQGDNVLDPSCSNFVSSLVAKVENLPSYRGYGDVGMEMMYEAKLNPYEKKWPGYPVSRNGFRLD